MHCTVDVMGIREQNSWRYNSCGSPNCMKGLKPVEHVLWCESCDQICEFSVPRYRIKLEVSDGTTTLFVTIFAELAKSLVKKPCSSLLEEIWENYHVDDNEIPHEVLQLVGTTHVLELKTHSYYDHGTYECFTASRLIRTIPINPPSAEQEGSTNDEQLNLEHDAALQQATDGTNAEDSSSKASKLADPSGVTPHNEKESLEDIEETSKATIETENGLKRKMIVVASPEEE